MNRQYLYILMIALLSVSVMSETLLDSDDLDYNQNALLDNLTTRYNMIFPAILLLIGIVAFALDFGAIGVNVACGLSLIVLKLLNWVYLDYLTLATFIILLSIVIYKTWDR